MKTPLPIVFPTEAEQARQQAELVRGLSAAERVWAAADTLAAVEALACAGGRYTEAVGLWEQSEREWQERIEECITRYVHRFGTDLPG
jgi:hypothetical protein